jgi:hypothetical protein
MNDDTASMNPTPMRFVSTGNPLVKKPLATNQKINRKGKRPHYGRGCKAIGFAPLPYL